jgi:Ni,Fe-hydrogenase I small subunit
VPVKKKDPSLKRYGRYTAIRKRVVKRNGKNLTELLCRCDCGRENWVNATNVGRRRGMGCLACANAALKPVRNKWMEQLTKTRSQWRGE